MNHVVLIACVSKKLSVISKAADLYISPLFRLNMKYAKKLNPDAIYILSAKHGLLNTNDEIPPYNETLNNMGVKERKLWANRVIKQLKENTDLQSDRFTLLAGNRYREYLLPHLTSYEVPLEGLTIGRQLQYLNNELENE